MISELKLFKDNIKPALLEKPDFYKKNHIDINKYYNTKFRNDIIISHKPLYDVSDKDCALVGKILGYYPHACDILYNEKNELLKREFLNFNGIMFNTCGLYDEAFKWCMEQYREKMLSKYKRIIYCKYDFDEDKKVVQLVRSSIKTIKIG